MCLNYAILIYGSYEAVHKTKVTKTVVKQHFCGNHNGFHKVKVTKTGLEHFICGGHHKFVMTINHSTKSFCQTALHQTTTFVDLWTFHR